MKHRCSTRPAIWLLALSFLVLPQVIHADEPFLVEHIELLGLQRIQEGTVFNYLPVSIGDMVDRARVAQAVRALFATTFFDDVEIRRDGNTLVVVVRERPTIARFSISGNKDIKDDDLRRVLRGVGLSEGRIFNRSVLENVELELRRQYYSRGKYGVRVNTDVRDLSNNMVSISIVIQEGLVARIREINFTGNRLFDDDRLRREMELRTTNWLSWLRSDDQYSREKLQGDLEELRSFYMDRGYAAFNVLSTQIAISPDKKDMYVTINVDEGERYTFGQISLAGNLIIEESDLRQFIAAREGETFSRAALTNSTEWMAIRLGQEGYAYAEITPIPDIDHGTRVVEVLLHVNPGSRVHVRRITFEGAPRTEDETYRREMRQLEGTWLQTGAIERSRFRLQRLPFVESVDIETVPVPGSEDLVDIEVEIKERNPGDFQFGVGYSGAYGILLNTGLTHSNFRGRGQRAEVDLNRSRFNQSYAFNFTEPYWTTNGISRTTGLFYQSMDSLFLRTSPFLMDAYGGNLALGIPVSEFNRINIGIAVRDTKIQTTLASAPELVRWVRVPTHGDTFEIPDPFLPGAVLGYGTRFRTLELSGGFVTDTRNRAIFATTGTIREYGLEVAVPPSDVTYVIARFNNHSFLPMSDRLTLSVRGGVRAGKALGDTQSIPPYRHFFAGGPDSVRGFRENWLGPRDAFGLPYGGNIMVYGQAELVILPPFERWQNNTRFSVFMDAGDVFDGRNNVKLDELRASAGVAVTWLAPIGALKFSFGVPLRRKDGDDIERFQFSIGSAF